MHERKVHFSNVPGRINNFADGPQSLNKSVRHARWLAQGVDVRPPAVVTYIVRVASGTCHRVVEQRRH